MANCCDMKEGDLFVCDVCGLELRVAKEDFGKIIGKQGRTAYAIRTILSAASAKMKKRCVLEILE